MGVAIWFNAVILCAVAVALRRPITRDIAPRLRFELATVIGTALVGSIIGGGAGQLVAMAGLAPFVAVSLLRRRVVRLQARDEHRRALRTLDLLDAVSWPVTGQPFNLGARLTSLLSTDGPDAMEAHLSRLRRPTRASRLMTARLSDDPVRIRASAAGILADPAQVEDHLFAFPALARTDLPAALDWLGTEAGRRAARRQAVLAELAVLAAGGRAAAVTHLARAIGLSEVRVAGFRAMAEIASGVPSEDALAPLDRFGELGVNERNQVAALSIAPQPLDAEHTRIVDDIADRATSATIALGHDVGRWRPVLSMSLAAGLVLAYVVQRSAGPVTEERVYDQGAFVTGEGWQAWRALIAPYLHANVAHLLSNVLGLLFLGRIVESRMSRPWFIAIWIATSSGAFVVVGVFEHRPGLHLGASGGVLGLVGAGLAVVGLIYRATRRPDLVFAVRWLLIIVAVQVIADQVIEGISWQGHLAGLAIGLVAGAIAFVSGPAFSAAGKGHEYRSE